MTISEIPLSPENQRFFISVAGRSPQMAVIRRAVFWYLDIMNNSGVGPIKGIPLITGTDLLAQYHYLGLGLSFYVGCDNQSSENPTEADLGICSHLYTVTG